MNQNTLLKIAFAFSIIGLLFSGYLTFSKLITGTCAISEGCSYFLGYPTCEYGFVMYLVLSVLLGALLFGKKQSGLLKNLAIVVAAIGVLFSLYFTTIELPTIGTIHYSLLLPTCVYGFVMYIIIFVAAFLAFRKK